MAEEQQNRNMSVSTIRPKELDDSTVKILQCDLLEAIGSRGSETIPLDVAAGEIVIMAMFTAFLEFANDPLMPPEINLWNVAHAYWGCLETARALTERLQHERIRNEKELALGPIETKIVE